MFKLLRFVFLLAFGLLVLGWRLFAWFLGAASSADRGAAVNPNPYTEYRDWNGTVRPYSYDSHGNPTSGEGLF